MIERVMWEEFAIALDKLEKDGEAFDVLCAGRALIRLGAPGLLSGPSDEQRVVAMKLETKKQAQVKYVQARNCGYTGEECRRCHSMRMTRSGTCSKCEECGEQGGCV